MHEHEHHHHGEHEAHSAPCCACGHTHAHAHEHAPDGDKRALVTLLLGAAGFAAGIIAQRCGAPMAAQLVLYLAAYLLLGGEVLLGAAKNIVRGQVFDENFLMSLATLGALAIREYPEAVGVMLFYRIGEAFEERAVSQSRKQIMAAVDLRPEVVHVVCGEAVTELPAAEAAVGDVLLVRPGDRIPLDGLVLEGESRIDTSPITGESVPVRAAAGSSVTSGCMNLSGALKMRVEKPLAESMVSRILESVEHAAASKPAIDRFITRFARVYTPAVVILALLIALIPPFVFPNWYFFIDPDYRGALPYVYGAAGVGSVFTALTFLVISCPCALVLSIPLAFFSGVGAGSRKGILFKGGLAIEALAKVKAVVLDKTGTITQGDFRVQQLSPAAHLTEEALLALAAACESASTHPIAASITAAARDRGVDFVQPAALQETAGLGIEARMGEETLLCGSRALLEGRGIALPPRAEAAGTEVFLARGSEYLGCILISDTLRPDAPDAIAALRRQGLHTVMLTGDAPESAAAVARRTGIDELHARLLPEEKLTHLQAVRAAHGSAMFIGDGINDAPVLAGADVGAAMGSGADAAIEAADLVLMRADLSAVPEAIALARATKRISWQNIVFALAVKLAVLLLGLAGYANMWFAVFADTGVAMLCLLNSIRLLRWK